MPNVFGHLYFLSLILCCLKILFEDKSRGCNIMHCKKVIGEMVKMHYPGIGISVMQSKKKKYIYIYIYIYVIIVFV